MMYSMKEACIQTGMSYETLKFYCKEGLVPNVKRDSHNYRVFDDRDIKWIQSLGCLKRCGMTLAEMKEYLFIGNQIAVIFDFARQDIIVKILFPVDIIDGFLQFFHRCEQRFFFYRENFFTLRNGGWTFEAVGEIFFHFRSVKKFSR